MINSYAIVMIRTEVKELHKPTIKASLNIKNRFMTKKALYDNNCDDDDENLWQLLLKLL